MGTRMYFGVLGPDGTYRGAYRQWGDHPIFEIPDIRADWQHYGRDLVRYLSCYGLTLDGIGDAPESHYGRLTESAEDIEGLYLIDPDHDGVAHYVPNREWRWQLFSRHLLAAGDDDLFVLDGNTVRCTGCTTVDKVEFTTAASSTGAGLDAVVTCRHCTRAEATTPVFTRHRQGLNGT